MRPCGRSLFASRAETNAIAVVGASGGPSKPAHSIPRYLQQQGYRILAVELDVVMHRLGD